METEKKMQKRKLLMVEDTKADAFLIQFYLEQSQKYEMTSVVCLKDAIDAMKKEDFDMILLDMNLPDSREIDTLKTWVNHFPHHLVIVLTGRNDENIGLESMQLGAQDFIIKGKFDAHTLGMKLDYAYERFNQIKRYEEMNELIELLVESNYISVYTFDLAGNYKSKRLGKEVNGFENYEGSTVTDFYNHFGVNEDYGQRIEAGEFPLYYPLKNEYRLLGAQTNRKKYLFILKCG